MGESENKESRVETWQRSLKNHPAIAVLLILAAIVTGIASFTESIDRLLTYFKSGADGGETAKRSEQDIQLEQSMVGTWRPFSKPPAPSGVVVIDFNFTFMASGIMNWGGSYRFGDHEVPIMMSGKWRIEDSVLHYEVVSSNVPLIAKEGFSSTSKITGVTSNMMTYVDSFDRKKKIASRIE